MERKGRVEGKAVWATGAGLGLGRASSILLASEGAHILVTDYDPKVGQETVTLIRSAGGTAEFFPLDVTKPADWDAARVFCSEMFGRLDVMLNNAGIAIAANIETTTLADWHRTMAVNGDGVFLGCQHAVALMKPSGGGSIINLSSIDGIIGEAELAAYCASKGAVRTLTKAVAVHCAEHKYNKIGRAHV